ncbi:peptide ABC transporter substrate-binding protein [Amycolatopsis sp. H20-H5]|uniref:peptide ABC transporter substrate-binding protein n=1 Tax=Amycolatopsis sp. H20-H5 TaxID=3046309 RepID=UPI002DBF1E77|nr:ABC transporter substrate-binding protein [Amycolatopsis sp. H20-H5]MEC3982348.1 ABC transporter substrate-binding protein [Amycolatopsis sp. H20-H5]
MRLRVSALPVLGVLGLLVVSGCSDSAAPTRPGVLTAALREPATLLPADVHDQAGRLVTGALWTPLADYDATTGKLTPRAAESITSTDQVHWTVKLRAGGKFHDGTPVTSQSYLDTWNAVTREHWTASDLLRNTLGVKEIAAPGPATVTLTLEHPSGQALAMLASPSLVPLPASVLASHDWAGFAKSPVGNGPFKLDGPWQPGGGGKLIRVADAPGKAREIDLKVGDPAAQYDEVKAGKLDLATEVPGDRHDAMHTEFADRHVTWPLPDVTYLAFPLQDKRFQDSTVRHGFALGVDRAALEAGPLAHQIDPARALLPPADAPGERSGTCRPCSFDGPAAKALLTQATFSGATTVYFGPEAETWAKPLAEQLHTALGVDVTAKPRQGTAPTDGPYTLTVPLASPSPHELLAALAKATGYTADGFTQLLDSADTAANADASGRLYRLAENQLLRDLPVAPLWSGHGHAVWTDRAHNVTATPFGDVNLAEITI